MMTRRMRTMALGIVALIAAPAIAHEVDVPADLNPLTVQAEAGVASYFGELNDHTRIGPAWGVTVGTERWDLVGIELAYQGSHNFVSENIGPRGAAIWRNGISGLAKLGPQVTPVVKPYVGVGVGASYINPNEEAEPLYRNDFMAEIPLALGVEARRGPLNAGVRVTYRLLAGEEFADDAGFGRAEGSLLSTTLNFGGRF